MKKTMVVELKRPAKKKGGDRYEVADFVIYIPQDISRQANGAPYPHISITFEAE